jgi:hypothetical protein
MADIFPKQSAWGSEFFSDVAEDASFLGCYAMYGPSGMSGSNSLRWRQYIPSKD